MNQRICRIAFAAAVALSLSANAASAALITGQFSVNGQDILSQATNQMTFVAGTSNIASGASQTGDFSAAFGGVQTPITMLTQGTAFNYTAIAANTVFLTGPNNLSFTVTSETVNTNNPGDVSYTLFGNWTLDSLDPTPGSLRVTSQGPDSQVSFSATAVAVPGPIVGAGVPGLIAACAGLLALARRRRQKFA